MEIIGLIAAIFGIITGSWFIFEKIYNRLNNQKSKNSFYIKNLFLEKTPLFTPDSTLSLGKVTTIIGKNGVGKTAVCEWLSVIETRKNVDRWRSPNKHLPIIYSIEHDSKIRVTVDENRVSFFQNDQIVPEPNNLCKFIFLKKIRFNWNEVDELGALSILLNLDREVILEYLSRVGQAFYCTIKQIKSEMNKNGKINIDVSFQDSPENVRFGQLSQSEQGRVVLEVALAISQYISKNKKVILIIERHFSSLDQNWMQTYVNWVISENLNFQIIFNTTQEFGDVDWSECKKINISGKPPNASFKYQ